MSSVSIETRHNVTTNNKQGQVTPPPVWSLPPTCALREANTIVTFKVVDLMPRCHSLQWKCLSKLHSDVVYVFMVAWCLNAMSLSGSSSSLVECAPHVSTPLQLDKLWYWSELKRQRDLAMQSTYQSDECFCCKFFISTFLWFNYLIPKYTELSFFFALFCINSSKKNFVCVAMMAWWGCLDVPLNVPIIVCPPVGNHLTMSSHMGAEPPDSFKKGSRSQL